MPRAPPNLPHPALLHGPLRLLALLLKPFSDEHQERHFERQFSYRTAVVLVRLPYQIRDIDRCIFSVLLSTKACDRGPRRQSSPCIQQQSRVRRDPGPWGPWGVPWFRSLFAEQGLGIRLNISVLREWVPIEKPSKIRCG